MFAFEISSGRSLIQVFGVAEANCSEFPVRKIPNFAGFSLYKAYHGATLDVLLLEVQFISKQVELRGFFE